MQLLWRLDNLLGDEPWEVFVTSTGQLRDLLAKFFIASAAAVIRHFERHDVPLTIFEPRAIPFRIVNSWGIAESPKSINVLASEDFWLRYKTPVLSRNMVRNARNAVWIRLFAVAGLLPAGLGGGPVPVTVRDHRVGAGL